MLSNVPKVTQRKHGTVKHFTPVFTFQEIILELLIAGVGIVALRHWPSALLARPQVALCCFTPRALTLRQEGAGSCFHDNHSRGNHVTRALRRGHSPSVIDPHNGLKSSG